MKATRILTIGVSVVVMNGAAAGWLAAQDDPVPKEPLIPRAQDMTAWTITYRYKSADTEPKPNADKNAKPPDRIVSVQVAKAGKTYHRVTNWASGTQTDTWNVGARQLAKDKTMNSYILMPSEGVATDDYSASDFEDLAWITMKQYAGFKKGEQPVFVFQAKNTERPLTRRDKFNLAVLSSLQPKSSASKASPGAAPANSDTKDLLAQLYGDTTATVVLDAKTQLPVAYDDGKTIWTYQFFTPPADFFVPPPEATKLLRRFDDYVKGITLRPSTP